MHDVTSWQVSMSEEHNETKNKVSSFVEQAVRSGTSSDSSESSYVISIVYGYGPMSFHSDLRGQI